MQRNLTLALAILIVAAVAGAELSQSYKDWPSSPAGYLLTKPEKKAYQALKTDAEAQAFIDLFWAKRNPVVDSPLNQFKEDFDANVKAADKMWSTDKVKGSMTDRGKVLIVMGKPSRLVAQKQVGTGGEEGSYFDLGRAPHGADIAHQAVHAPGALPTGKEGRVIVWRYQKDRLPAGVKEEQVSFYFAESRAGAMDFLLDRGDSRNKTALSLVADAAERSIITPNLTEVPKLGLLTGSKAANASQLALLATRPRPWPQGAKLAYAQGLVSDSKPAVWVHAEIPDPFEPAKEAIGRVLNANNEEKGTFVVPATPLTITGGRAYEFSIPLGAGAWKIELALLEPAGILAIKDLDVTVNAMPDEGPYISSFYSGVDIRKESQARLGDPFNVGGWHVLPRVGNQYVNSESLSYFCFVVRPPLDAQGQPEMSLSLQLFSGDNKLLSSRPPEPASLSQVSRDVWMFGSGLPLGVFRQPNDYRLEVTLSAPKVVTKVARVAASAAPTAGMLRGDVVSFDESKLVLKTLTGDVSFSVAADADGVTGLQPGETVDVETITSVSQTGKFPLTVSLEGPT